MTDHEHVWVKNHVGSGGCQCGTCYEKPGIELICDDVDCLESLDPCTPGYDEILESAAWF